MNKTNAARILDRNNIKYELIEYPVDENDLSAHHIAASVGENIKQTFKTLIVKGGKTGIFVCVIAGNLELDLKKAARESGNKSAQMIAVKDLFKLTGYIRGGCSPLAMKKEYPVYFHKTCLDFDYIYISAGIRGMQIKANPQHLISVTKAKVCDLAE